MLLFVSSTLSMVYAKMFKKYIQSLQVKQSVLQILINPSVDDKKTPKQKQNKNSRYIGSFDILIW